MVAGSGKLTRSRVTKGKPLASPIMTRSRGRAKEGIANGDFYFITDDDDRIALDYQFFPKPKKNENLVITNEFTNWNESEMTAVLERCLCCDEEHYFCGRERKEPSVSGRMEGQQARECDGGKEEKPFLESLEPSRPKTWRLVEDKGVQCGEGSYRAGGEEDTEPRTYFQEGVKSIFG